MGVRDFVRRHYDRHWGGHLEDYRGARDRLRHEQDAEEKKRLEEQMRRSRNRMAMTAGAGLTLGAGYLAYKGGKKAVDVGREGIRNQWRNATGYDILILLTLLMYAVAPVWRVNFGYRLTLQLAVFFLVLFFVLSPSEKNRETYTVMLMIFIIEVFLPQIAYGYDFLMKNTFVVNYLLNPQVTLLWFYFAVFRSPGTGIISKLARWLVFLVWTFIVLSFVMNTFSVQDVQAAMTPEQIESAENLYIETAKWWKDIIVNFQDVMRQGRLYFENRMRLATGDYYTGFVDENQQETLGLYIKDVKASDREFYTGEPVSVWALLEAKTLEDGLKVDVECYHGRKKSDGSFETRQKGTTYPQTIPIVYDEEQIDLDCRFDSGVSASMIEGSNRVTVAAVFHFETLAYLKMYFMDRDRLRSMQRQGIDPLEEYGITDKSPSARYTNGPVKIGMGSAEGLVGISDSFSVNPRLGITLMTNDGWKGKIKQLTGLVVMVPDTLSLDTVFCPEFEEVSDYGETCVEGYVTYRSAQFLDCLEQNGHARDSAATYTAQNIPENVKACMNEYCTKELVGYKAYRLKITEETKQYYTNIGYEGDLQKDKTFSCRLKIDEPENLLGGVPVSTQYVRVKARYDYTIEETTNVLIKKGAAGTTEVPKPTKEGIQNIPFVYNSWGAQIMKYCRENVPGLETFDTPEECLCTVAAIINQESRGDANALGDAGEKGLMQILPATADLMKGQYQIDMPIFDLYDPDTNIRVGMLYLHYLKKQIPQVLSQYNTGKTYIPDYLYAAYNGGTCGTKPGSSDTTGALCPSKDCEGSLAYQCPVNQGELKNTASYVSRVSDYKHACMNMQLTTYGAHEEDFMAADFLEAESTLSLKTNDYTPLGNSLEIYAGTYSYQSPVPLPQENSQYSYLKLFFSKNNNRVPLGSETAAGNTAQSQFTDYPFMLYTLEGDSLKIAHWKRSLVTRRLEEDEKTLDTSGSSIKKLTGVWVKEDTNSKKTYIYAYYTGREIEMYDMMQQKFCSISWGRDTPVGFCEGVPGFMVRRIETETREKDNVKPYTIVQFVYDPGLEDPCCKECTMCDTLQCMTCAKECALGNLGTNIYSEHDDYRTIGPGQCFKAGDAPEAIKDET